MGEKIPDKFIFFFKKRKNHIKNKISTIIIENRLRPTTKGKKMESVTTKGKNKTRESPPTKMREEIEFDFIWGGSAVKIVYQSPYLI